MRLATLVAILGLLGAVRDDKPCDLKKTDDALWCSKCKAVRDADDVDKEGKCGDCKTKTEKVKVCVKAYYKANCCGTTHEEQGSC